MVGISLEAPIPTPCLFGVSWLFLAEALIGVPQGPGPASTVLCYRLEVDRASPGVTGSFYATWREGAMELFPLGNQLWLLTRPSPAHSGALSWVAGGPASRCGSGRGSRGSRGFSGISGDKICPEIVCPATVPVEDPDSSRTTSQGLVRDPEVKCWEYLLQ